MKHRWGDRRVINANKTERECQNGCGIVRVTRHETDGPRDVHWVEFWRGLDQLGDDGRTPVCEPVKADA